MTTNQIRLSKRYLSVLKGFLKLGSSRTTDWTAATRLGFHIRRLGVGTLQLARIHELALKEISISSKNVSRFNKARQFFDHVNIPSMVTPGAARQQRIELNRLNLQLGRRTAELAAANRHLKSGMRQRKTVERALMASGSHYSKLLSKSLQLQAQLRALTHRIFEAQEKERKKISLELQDEVSQTLIGINVRLLNYKDEARVNGTDLKRELSITQRLVAKSANSMRRMAREFRKQ